MRVAFWPRDSNPYQARLIDALQAEDVQVGYLGELTGSHTLNVLLLPIEVVAARLRGTSIVHLHWLYRFNLPIVRGKALTRRLSRVWFAIVLAAIRACRMRLVWTAHNVLPHTQVFDDDSRARIQLLRSCAAVIVHSPETTSDIARRGWPLPAIVTEIPPAPLVEAPSVSQESARVALGLPLDGCVAGLVGRIDRYKGPTELIRAASEAAVGDQEAEGRLTIVIAGRCTDEALAAELRQLAEQSPVEVRLDLRELTDQEFDSYLAALDVFAVPFQRATTSGSVATALVAGLTVLVPEHVVLGDIPGELITRYRDLGAELRNLARDRRHNADEHRARALAWVRSRGWSEVAKETAALYRAVE